MNDVWHWERIKNISDYPRLEYLATCTCGWDCFWPRQQLDTARSDWEDHIMEAHNAGIPTYATNLVNIDDRK